MNTSPILYRWDGEAMHPWRRFAKQCDKQFVVGADYILTEQEDRSAKSHRHYFACIHDCWRNLPDNLTLQFTDDEMLRKHALIMTGWHIERKLATSSPAEARKIAAFMMDSKREYALFSVAGNVVVERTARSQKTRGPERMSNADFKKSKQDVLDWIAELIGVSPDELSRAASPPTVPSHEHERERV